jgi:N2-citryl-N6-acetyl-N6-hydroxylysine synthase
MNAHPRKSAQKTQGFQHNAADLAGLSAFLNALMREWDGWHHLSPEQKESLALSGAAVALPVVSPRGEIIAGLRQDGAFRRSFSGRLIWRGDDGALAPLSAHTAISLLCFDTGASPGTAQKQRQLLARVLDSLQTVAASPEPLPKPATQWNFVDAEQALRSGHPMHPNPRSRDEMSAEDAQRFAPEMRGRFPLFWVLAERSVLSQESAADRSAEEMCAALIASDDTLPGVLRRPPEGFVALPWHPWQAARLLARPDVAGWIAQGRLRIIGEAGRDWAPTGSMRSVHGWHAPYMLKFSLSLRLTNSRRVLAPKEVARGEQMYRLFQSPLGAQIRAENPEMTILQEPAHIALRGADGGPVAESIAVFRENPFRDPAQPGPVMLASLCEERAGGLSPLGAVIETLSRSSGRGTGEIAQDWFARFLGVALAPLLRLRARHGLLMGAHQQNMMIGLCDGWPARLVVRDCQGTGHLTTFHDHLARYVPDIGAFAENEASPELGDGLFCYYVIVNNVMNVASTLALDTGATEAGLHDVLRRFLQEQRAAEPGDTGLIDMLLTAPSLTSKGNYRTSLSGVNEAAGDASGQLAAFLMLPNPLSQETQK